LGVDLNSRNRAARAPHPVTALFDFGRLTQIDKHHVRVRRWTASSATQGFDLLVGFVDKLCCAFHIQHPLLCPESTAIRTAPCRSEWPAPARGIGQRRFDADRRILRRGNSHRGDSKWHASNGSGTIKSFAALLRHHSEEEPIPAAKKKTARGRKQDRARVAGGQDYEVRYESKKSGRSAAAVKKAVKRVGNSRKRVEKRLGR
jgi:hypothetical protein